MEAIRIQKIDGQEFVPLTDYLRLKEDKEIFIDTDWSFLNTEQPRFRMWSDIDSKIEKWYFLKTRKYSRDILIWDEWYDESDIKAQKKKLNMIGDVKLHRNENVIL